MNRFKLFEDSHPIGRIEKEVPIIIKKSNVRFVISNSFLQFSSDLWEECFEGMNSIRLAKVNEDDNGNTVDWLFIKGYKGKVGLKNDKNLHKVNDRSGTGSKYLNLTTETFNDLNEKLNSKKGGVKSRLYKFPDENKSSSENLVIVDFNDRSNWENSSKKRSSTDDTDVK